MMFKELKLNSAHKKFHWKVWFTYE